MLAVDGIAACDAASGTSVTSLKPKVLAEAFVVCEEKRLVFLDRPAERTAEHVALELRNRRRDRRSSARRARCCAGIRRRCRGAGSCPRR